MDAPHKYLKARQAEFDRKVEAGIRHFSETGQPIPDVARVPAAEGSSWCLDGSATDTNFGTVDYIVGKYTPKRLAEILLKQQKESRYHRRLNKLADHDWKKLLATLSEMETKHALSTAHQESLLKASKERQVSLWKQVTDLEPLVERLEARDEENDNLMRLYRRVSDECCDLQEQLKMARSENEKGLMVTRDLLEEEIGNLQELYSDKEVECGTLREQLKMARSENEKGIMVTRDLLEEEIGNLQELYSEKEEECESLREQLKMGQCGGGRLNEWD